MKNVNNVFVGFMSGLISAMVLLFLFTLVGQHKIVLDDNFKYTLYRLMVWGGVWAILFALPISKNIWLKSSIVGLAVVFFNFIVLMPLQGSGFFGVNAGSTAIIMNIVFNYLWGIVAGIIYNAVSNK